MLLRIALHCLLLIASAGLLLAPTAAADVLGPRTDLTPAERDRAIAALTQIHDADRPEPFEALPGGAMTHHLPVGPESFSEPHALLNAEDLARFDAGRRLFRLDFAATGRPGLGPLYNASSCEACHQRDGRGDDTTGRVLRLYGPDGSPHLAYGRQVQDRAQAGMSAEGRLSFDVGSGHAAPVMALTDLSNGPIGDDTGHSVRMAPALVGLGLIAAISPDDIRLRVDPDDLDGDGISGMLRELGDGKGFGRFGWKAEAADIPDQIASAFATDMGLSSSRLPEPAGDCGSRCPPPTGTSPEVSDAEIADLAFYLESLAFPRRQDFATPDALAGKAIFHEIGCAACHHPSYVTLRLPDAPARSYQLIRPYSDFLLHDMGEELADGGTAHPFAREWRTPPLWGLGLAGVVNDGIRLLHDGRAGSIEAAILWHGGEGVAAKARFESLEKADRQRLLAFLNSL